MTNRLRLFGLVFVGSLCANAMAGTWDGRYVFTDHIGHTAGGSPMSVEYVVTVTPAVARPCFIRMEGFQTDEELLCTARENGNKLVLDFKSYADGSVKNIHGVGVYPVGAPLLTLEWLENKSGRTLRTTWQNLGALDGKPKQPGVYFRQDRPQGR